MLPSIDQAHLDERAPGSTVTNDGSMICVLIPNYVLPSGFTATSSDLLIRLSPGYPDVPPDMWWFDPPVRRIDGQVIVATESMESHLGRPWQRAPASTQCPPCLLWSAGRTDRWRRDHTPYRAGNRW